MNKIFLVLLTIFVFQVSAHAADKIRIGYPARLGHFITLPLAQKKGFFREEGIEAEMILLRGPATQAAFLNGEIDYFPGIGAMVSCSGCGRARKGRSVLRTRLSYYVDRPIGV